MSDDTTGTARPSGWPTPSSWRRSSPTTAASQLRVTLVVGMMGDVADSDDVRVLRREPTWTVQEIASGHWPLLTAPDELATIIAEAATS